MIALNLIQVLIPTFNPMINIGIVRDKDRFIWEITVEGHAGAGKYGSDIVCAAVSTLAYTAINALDELAGIRSYSVEDGYIKCTVPPDIPEDKKQIVRNILDTVVIGFKQIQYTPDYRKYISVLDKEVL